MRSNAEEALDSCIYPTGACTSMLTYASVGGEARSGLRTLRPELRPASPDPRCEEGRLDSQD